MRKRIRVSFWSGAGVALVVLGLAGSASGAVAESSAAATWAGTWSITDYGTAGAAAGGTYPWSVTLAQSGGTLTSTGTPSPYAVAGSASGSTAHFKASGSGGYVATFTVKLSADGTTFKGTWTDSQGSAGTVVAHGGTPRVLVLRGRFITPVAQARSRSSFYSVHRIGPGDPRLTVLGGANVAGTFSATLKKAGIWRLEPRQTTAQWCVVGPAHCYHGADVTFTDASRTVSFEWYTIHIAKHGAGSIGSRVHDFAKIG